MHLIKENDRARSNEYVRALQCCSKLIRAVQSESEFPIPFTTDWKFRSLRLPFFVVVCVCTGCIYSQLPNNAAK